MENAVVIFTNLSIKLLLIFFFLNNNIKKHLLYNFISNLYCLLEFM